MENHERKRLLLLVNPRAGQMRMKPVLLNTIDRFCRAGFDVTAYTTGSSGDARRRVAVSETEGYDLIVCCGGDGTLNEVISGMIDAGIDCALGYVPCGTTNDFAAALSIPRSIPKAVDAILAGKERRIDVGQFGDDAYFSYVASTGIFTRASFETPQNAKNALGHLAYLLNGMKELADVRTFRVAVSGPDIQTEESDVLFAAVTNTTSIGGVIGLPKQSVCFDDGLFELLLIKKPKTALEWNGLLTSVASKEYTDKNVILLQAGEMTIETETGHPWTRDGENGGMHQCVTVRNLQERIRIIAAEPDTQHT